MKTYVRRFTLPGAGWEDRFLEKFHMTCFEGVYPYKLFPEKGLDRLDFAPITILCGGNGSGKTTLLNLIAEKAGVRRRAPFNRSAFFETFVERCGLEGEVPAGSQILTSDDVFDYLLDLRTLNDGIDLRRREIMEEYTQRKYAHHQLRSLEDYEDWKESCEAKSRSKSQFVRDRVMRESPLHSNGESAMGYFTEHIRENALYLLDEPENSLSLTRQQELAQFLSESARFFGCQFVLATHSPVLLALEGARVYDLDRTPVSTCRWTEVENVRACYDFFQAHRREFEETQEE